MAFNKQQVFDHITTVDSWLSINDTLGSIRIRELIAPLIESINDDGAVSYVIGTNERFRSSTLATVLDALNDVKLLPRSAIYQMQDHLYSLRNKFVPHNPAVDDVIVPDQSDTDAWGRDEAPSVWTTSKAIIALMTTDFVNRDNISNKRVRNSLRNSVYWLAKQAYSDGGWGYQKYQKSASCRSNVPMTALAMKALILAQRNESLFNQSTRSSSEFNNVTGALTSGAEYLLREKKEDDGKVYWEYNGEPGAAITMWAIDALALLCALRPNDNHLRSKYDEIAPKATAYVLAMLPDQDALEGYKQSELFFKATNQEGALKYKTPLKKDKCFYTFKPYIVSSLLDRGIDPTHPKIVAMVKWLLSNREKRWAISEYNSSSPCSISSAMAINVIVKWLMKMSVNSFSASVNSLINDTNSTDCKYGLQCDRVKEDDFHSVLKHYLLPTFVAVAISVAGHMFFPDKLTYFFASWFATAILLAFIVNLPVGKKLLKAIYAKRKDILWDIIVTAITTVVLNLGSIVGAIFQLIMQLIQENGGVL